MAVECIQFNGNFKMCCIFLAFLTGYERIQVTSVYSITSGIKTF